MIVIALALLAEATSSTGTPRKALSECLDRLIQPAADANTKPADFVEQTKQKCTAQQVALQQFLVQQNKSDGMNASAAEADAKDQVQELLDRVKDRYQDWYDNSSKKGA